MAFIPIFWIIQMPSTILGFEFLGDSKILEFYYCLREDSFWEASGWFFKKMTLKLQVHYKSTLRNPSFQPN